MVQNNRICSAIFTDDRPIILAEGAIFTDETSYKISLSSHSKKDDIYITASAKAINENILFNLADF